MTEHREQLDSLIGPSPSREPSFRASQRAHQGWFRAFVLKRPPGPYPRRADQTICNTISDPKDENFLTKASANALREAIEDRGAGAAGLIEPTRVRGNLLSSQPLAFNAFGELAADLALCTNWLRTLVPDVIEATAVRFEFRPAHGDIGDNSAFDVAVEYTCSAGPALLGLEVKYTDDFSAKRSGGTWYGGSGDRNEARYRACFERVQGAFSTDYVALVESPTTNQLFRNALIAETAAAQGQYAVVHTGLFFHPGDARAAAAVASFSAGARNVVALPLDRFVESLQLLQLSWPQRRWTMLLWARYLGEELSRSR